MRCIYCNTPLAEIDYCPGCGADVTLLKRIGRISNLLYNRGLEKAQVRDLSGAIGCLRQSLKFNKENTDARNLLGLCWYETGEVVEALSEWVISKNISPRNNVADRYLEDLQTNKNQLETINLSIRKYNQSIEYCETGSEDMAVMQLRKVVAMNPKLVKAQQLLALLYMKHGEYEKARRVLKKSIAIDNTNTTTLRYMSEIEEITGRSGTFRSRRRRPDSDEERADANGTLRYMSGTETIITPTTFRDSSTVATFINIGLGVLLGGAIVWFMAVPASRQSISEEANRKVTDANLQLASGNAQLSDLQDEIDTYKQQVEDANTDRDDALAKVDSYDSLLKAANTFVNGDAASAASAVSSIDSTDLEGDALELYNSLLTGVSSTLFNTYYSAGTTAYVQKDYQTAAEQLQKAVESDEEGTQTNYFNALYYLAFSYYNLGDSSNADKYFNLLIEKYPNQASAVQQYISSGTAETDASGTVVQSETQAQTAETSAETSAADVTGTSDGNVTIQETAAAETQAETQAQSNASPDSYAAWTDPTTGYVYDQYGNRFYG